MTLAYTLRPISDRTWMRPTWKRERSRFTASWSDTLTVLERELAHVRGKNVVLEIDVREQDIRLDGTLRANARTEDSPAVVVAFESKHGPLQYRSDLYSITAYGAKNAPAWQHNVRAIALTLESLRAVDRYGATSSGEQYRGFRAIETSRPSREQAEATLRKWAGPVGDLQGGLRGEQLARAARIGAHPDRHSGDHGPSGEVLEAIEVLGLA